MSAFFANGRGLVRLNMTKPTPQETQPVKPILLPVMTRWTEDDRRKQAQLDAARRKEKR